MLLKSTSAPGLLSTLRDTEEGVLSTVEEYCTLESEPSDISFSNSSNIFVQFPRFPLKNEGNDWGAGTEKEKKGERGVKVSDAHEILERTCFYTADYYLQQIHTNR